MSQKKTVKESLKKIFLNIGLFAGPGHEDRTKASEGPRVDVEIPSLYKTQVHYSPVHHVCHTVSVDF